MPPAPSSPFVLAALVAVLGLSSVTLLVLARRWTVGQRLERLRNWAARLKLAPTTNLPLFLSQTQATRAEPITGFASAEMQVLHFQTPTTPASKSPEAMRNWHLLVLRLRSPSAPTTPPVGLRPTSQRVSLIDLYGPTYARPGHELLSYPSLTTTSAEFILFGAVNTAPARIARIAELSHEVPDDLTLILTAEELLIDFSSRPFDHTTLTELLPVAQALASKV